MVKRGEWGEKWCKMVKWGERGGLLDNYEHIRLLMTLLGPKYGIRAVTDGWTDGQTLPITVSPASRCYLGITSKVLVNSQFLQN